MTLEDGTYEVKDLFYDDAGYMLAVAGGKLCFRPGTGPDAKLRLEIACPEADLENVVAVPWFSRKRGEFVKSLTKTMFKVSTCLADLKENLNGFLLAYENGSVFEKTASMLVFASGGLMAPSSLSKYPGHAVSPISKISPMLSMTVQACPNWPNFVRGLQKRNQNGRLEDKDLSFKYNRDPTSVKEYAWTKEDAEESRKILEANPFFREYLTGYF